MTRVNAVILGGSRLAAVLVLAATGWIGPDAAAADEAPLVTFIEADQFEYRVRPGDDAYGWEGQGWIGGDYDKLWFKTQGDGIIDGAVERAEMQALYSRTVSAFWDVQLGARYDRNPDPARGYAVLGIEGLAPYFFAIDVAAFVSNKGDASARLEAEYELLLTQRLIAKPSAELNFAVQEVEELGIGSGLSEAELGLRLRYEILREIAPYIGVSWEGKVGPTAEVARRAGADVSDLTFVTGIRFWF
jgi:copper resistance protein B